MNNGFLNRMNQANLLSGLDNIKQQLVMMVSKSLLTPAERAAEQPSLSDQQQDVNFLNSIGPAAAYEAVDHSIKTCLSRGLLNNIQFTNNHINNLKLIQNADVGAYPGFSGVLREFLLPRYAYLDFDTVVDPRHMIDHECGYPKFITPIMYRYMYDRDSMTRKVIETYPNESWATDPCVFEDEDETKTTEFEAAWEQLCFEHNIMQMLYRIDKLSGIGHYGVLLLGIGDTDDLSTPIEEPELLLGLQRTKATTQRPLLYMRPFDEYLSFIQQYETNIMHPRHGLPKFYNLVFLDMTIDAAGASIGTRLNRRVHWSRVIHIADNLGSSNVFGCPRAQPVFNELLNLRKIKGASAEMFWKGAWPGLTFEIDPRLIESEPEFDKEAFKEQLERFGDGMQRYLALVGIKATSLAPNISENPDRHAKIQMEAIAIALDMPLRMFMGSEEGKVASTTDLLNWNKRLGRRQKMHVDPFILRAFVDRMIAIGILPPPKSGRYYVGREDLNTSTDEDKANLSLKWTQALSQYVASGVAHLIRPMEYLTVIMGLKPSIAVRIVKEMEANGGLQKLLKVDPSQGAGANGNRQDIAGGAQDKDKPTKRDTADKKAEGTAS